MRLEELYEGEVVQGRFQGSPDVGDVVTLKAFKYIVSNKDRDGLKGVLVGSGSNEPVDFPPGVKFTFVGTMSNGRRVFKVAK